MKTYFHSIFLTRSKLLIRFIQGGERHSLILTPDQACNLLEGVGEIKGYTLLNGELIIYEDASWNFPHSQTGEPVEIGGYYETTWKDYVKDFNKKPLVNRYWLGKILLDWYIMQQEHEIYRQRLLSIPTLVRHFLPNQSA